MNFTEIISTDLTANEIGMNWSIDQGIWGRISINNILWTDYLFRLDALALSVIATATWLAGRVAGWLGGCPSQPVLYQND